MPMCTRYSQYVGPSTEVWGSHYDMALSRYEAISGLDGNLYMGHPLA